MNGWREVVKPDIDTVCGSIAPKATNHKNSLAGLKIRARRPDAGAQSRTDRRLAPEVLNAIRGYSSNKSGQ